MKRFIFIFSIIMGATAYAQEINSEFCQVKKLQVLAMHMLASTIETPRDFSSLVTHSGEVGHLYPELLYGFIFKNKHFSLNDKLEILQYQKIYLQEYNSQNTFNLSLVNFFLSFMSKPKYDNIDYKTLLERGIDGNIERYKLSPSLLNYALLQENYDAVNFLLSCGADINHASGSSTPFFNACKNAPLSIINTMIKYHKPILNNRIHNPLLVAAERGDTKIISLLLKAGANPYENISYSGETHPLMNILKISYAHHQDMQHIAQFIETQYAELHEPKRLTTSPRNLDSSSWA